MLIFLQALAAPAAAKYELNSERARRHERRTAQPALPVLEPVPNEYQIAAKPDPAGLDNACLDHALKSARSSRT
jgi:hypothetical protein